MQLVHAVLDLGLVLELGLALVLGCCWAWGCLLERCGAQMLAQGQVPGGEKV